MSPVPPFRSTKQARFVCLLIGVCLLVLGTTVPEAAAQSPRVGLRTGPTFGFMSNGASLFTGGQATVNANPRLDLHAGAYLVLPLTEAVSLQPELLYTRKGGHFSQPLPERYSVERYRLSYVQGLLLGRRSLPIPGRLSAHAVAGLSVDLTLSGAVRRNARTTEGTLEDHVDLLANNHLRCWDLGLVVGAGLGYSLGTSGRLSIDLRYNPGLHSVFSGGGNELNPSTDADIFPLASSPSTLRHDVVTASFTYTVPLRVIL